MKKIITICTTLLIALTSFATDYTIPSGSPVASWALPLYMGNTTSGAGNFYGSITQQIYLAEDLIAQEASAGNITDITFYYTSRSGYTASAITPRTIAIYLMESDVDEYPMYNFPYQDIYDNTQDKYLSYFLCDDDNKAGVKVFEGSLATEEVTSPTVKEVKLTFNVNNFAWSGTKNIVMTLVDKSATTHPSSNLRFQIVSTQTDAGTVNHPRFLDTYWTTSSDERAGWINTTSDSYNFSSKLGEYYGQFKVSNLTESEQKRQRSYVPKVTFSISPAVAPVVPATPTGLAASNIGVATASLSWAAVDGAVSYALYSSVDDETYTELATPSTNSYDWTGLSANSTYYVKVAAVNAAGSSDFSAPIFFTTLAPHIHDGISFEPWSNPSALPTSGNYYLNDDVAFDIESSDVTLTGNLNLCLNGHTADLYGSKIIVPYGKTLSIYDNVGGGKITGFVASEVGAADIYAKALIVVYAGGELELHQGTIENTYIPDGDGSSYAIYSNGTLHLSGDVLINSNDIDIYLYTSNIITLDGALSNAEKHTVYKNGGAFTSGWSTYMSGEDPRDYFESSNSARSVYFDGSEAALRLLLNLSENNQNSAIGTSYNQTVDVNLTRSTLYSAYYNTICLPFALSNAQLEEYFGAGYDLEEFVNSELDGDLLTLTFERKYALEAGKPYLLKPTVEVTDPSFIGVTITATSPVDITTNDVYFHGTYRPTELTGGNLNILFLYPDNELRWPAATENLKGFRAYFEIIGETSAAARRARIVTPSGTPTAVEAVVDSQASNRKWLKDGQIIIERNGRYYNITGQRIH